MFFPSLVWVSVVLFLNWSPHASCVRVPSPCYVNSSSISGDGKIVCWGVDDGSVFVKTGERKPILLTKRKQGILAVAHSANDELLAFACTEGDVSLWDLRTRKELWYVMEHKRSAKCLAFSPDGKFLATGGEEGSICLWETKTAKKIRPFLVHQQSKHPSPWVSALTFSPDGKFLASGSHDRTARIWDLAEGRLVFTFEADDEINSVRFSPNGRSFAVVAVRDPYLRLFETVTGKERARVKVGTGELVVAFTQDNFVAVIGGGNDAISVLDTASGQRLQALKSNNKAPILSIGISDDDTKMVASGLDKIVYFWQLKPTVRKLLALKQAEITKAWDQLNSADAMEAYQGIYALVHADHPWDNLNPRIDELVGKNLTQATFARIVKDLESDDSKIRQRAAHELNKLGSEARPFAIEALKADRSLDAFRAIRRFIETNKEPSKDFVGLTRVLEVLENRNDKPSIAVLQAISEASPGTAAHEARAVLSRLSNTVGR